LTTCNRLTLVLVTFLIIVVLAGCAADDWRTATRASAGLAPKAATTPEAVILVYGAPVFGWRGWFANHTWLAVKPVKATQYTVYEVLGWRVRHGLPALTAREDVPDRYWYGEKPQLIMHKQGPEAGLLIEKIEEAIERYPWKDEYRLFPGPNSNTFTAWISREIPELELDLPFRAIGSSWAAFD